MNPPIPEPALVAELERLRPTADFGLLPRAHGLPLLHGRFRCAPEDFAVIEDLPLEPTGDGEHLLLQIRKTGQNTRWVAKRLAETAGIAYAGVGYSGLKDRQAVAVQWFSLQLSGRPEPASFDIEGVEVLQRFRHRLKLRPGMHRGNRFRLRLREVRGDLDALPERLRALSSRGVPNYFGPQRFGRAAANLSLLDGSRALNRELRSFGLSALRAALFNGYLAMRVVAGSWDRVLPGEITPRGQDSEPTGLLWGVGTSHAGAAARDSEHAWFEDYPACLRVLESAGNRMLRRALRAVPEALRWDISGDEVELQFTLRRGAFATSLLREVGDFVDAASRTGEANATA